MLQLAGITFHLYGLVVGLGLVVALLVMEERLKHTTFPMKEWGPSIIMVGLGALVGARLYHVVTDWSLYSQHLNLIGQIWRGGLSIIGAVIGGMGTLGLWAWQQRWSRVKIAEFIDSVACGLPFGQAIGRVGNWVNQELYGPPTTYPWGLFIDEAHRLPAYREFTHFQPLFAFEAIPLLILGVLFWKWGRRPVGTGWYFWVYLCSYSFLRFMLDFWRLDKAELGGTKLGINQWVMLIVLGMSLFTLVKRYYTPSHFRATMNTDHGS